MASREHLQFTAVALALTAMLPSAVAQQVTAQVEVSHDDPDGVVSPGESIRVGVILKWQGTGALQFAGLRGDTVFTNDLGASANIISPYGVPSSSPPWVRLGDFRGGSIINSDIVNLPGYFTAGPLAASFAYQGMPFILFDWEAPSVSEPTQVNIDFRPYAIAPNARFYPSQISPAWVEADTTYSGTSVLVLPAPSALVAFLLAGGLAIRRRR